MIKVKWVTLEAEDGQKWRMSIGNTVTLLHQDVLNVTITINDPGGEPRPTFIGVKCPRCTEHFLDDSEDYVCSNCREVIISAS